MKKNVVKLFAVVAVLMLTLSFAGCAAGMDMVQKLADKVIPSHDYEQIIENFVPSGLNTKRLWVGQNDKPNGSVWLPGIMTTVYSSNEAVVTISDHGKVTAVGPGEAYVIITSGSLYEVTHYTVTVR